MMSEGAPERPEALSRADALKSLRETIQQLDRVARRLESATIEALPPTRAFERLAEGLEALEADLAPLTLPPSATEEAKTLPVPASQPGFFAKVRSLLPASLNEKLSNGAIAGILTGLVAAVVAFIAVLIPHPPQKTVAVAPAPPVIESPVPVVPAPSVVESPVPVIPEAPEREVPEEPVIETPVAIAPEEPAAPEAPVVEEEPIPPIETPSEPVAPEIATPTEEPIAVEVPPAAVLTPEERLISVIQTQVAQITSQYADGLIESIQADFIGSRLVAIVKDEWYDLTASRQDRVAQEMWTRSQELDFSKLELTDRKGNLLARSPVVGEEMAIFLRQRLESQPTPHS